MAMAEAAKPKTSSTELSGFFSGGGGPILISKFGAISNRHYQRSLSVSIKKKMILSYPFEQKFRVRGDKNSGFGATLSNRRDTGHLQLFN